MSADVMWWCGESENHIQKWDLHLHTERGVVSRKNKSNNVIYIIIPVERNKVSLKTKSKRVISIIMPVEKNEVSLKNQVFWT